MNKWITVYGSNKARITNYELEGGFMVSYKRLMLNLGTNVLNGYKTYATWDFTAGLGYRF